MHAIRRRGRLAAAASTLLLSAVLLGLSPGPAAAVPGLRQQKGQKARRPSSLAAGQSPFVGCLTPFIP